MTILSTKELDSSLANQVQKSLSKNTPEEKRVIHSLALPDISPIITSVNFGLTEI